MLLIVYQKVTRLSSSTEKSKAVAYGNGEKHTRVSFGICASESTGKG